MDPSRALRWTALAATALVALAAVGHGFGVAIHDPHQPSLVQMRLVERGEDYIAWTSAFAPRGHLSVFYTANGTPDRILLAREGDIGTILAGEPFAALAEFDVPSQRTGPPFTHGRFDVAPPHPTCPPPTGACIDETVPVLVWMKGDAWRGVRYEDRTYYVVATEAWTGPPITNEPHDGPVRPALNRGNADVVARAPAVLAFAAIAGAVAIGSVVAHAAIEIRRARREPLVPPAPVAESTETMLMLARLTTLYVDAVRRSFLVSLAAILGLTAAVMFFGLPPMLERTTAQFRYQWELMEQHVALFVLTPLLVAFVALVLWLVAYLRVARELREWRRRARGLEEEGARILGA